MPTVAGLGAWLFSTLSSAAGVLDMVPVMSPARLGGGIPPPNCWSGRGGYTPPALKLVAAAAAGGGDPPPACQKGCNCGGGGRPPYLPLVQEKNKKTRCMGLYNYFKAAVCLILGSNTPPTPPHAGVGGPHAGVWRWGIWAKD